MKGITIRFGPSSHDLIRNEARREGITMSAFIREASLARAFIAKGRRGEDLNEIIQAVRDYLHAERTTAGNAPEPPSGDAESHTTTTRTGPSPLI